MNRGRGRGGRGGNNGSRVMKSNHVIQCILFKNVALFKGDTYTYRGLFRRNGGNFNREFYGFVVSLEAVDKIKNELTPMLSGFTIHHRDGELPVEVPKTFIDDPDDNDEGQNSSRVSFRETSSDEIYENNTDTTLDI